MIKKRTENVTSTAVASVVGSIGLFDAILTVAALKVSMASRLFRASEALHIAHT